MPNGSFKTLSHSAFQVTYPANWEVFGDESSSVTIAPRAGMTADAVAYGAIPLAERLMSGPQPGYPYREHALAAAR